MSNNLFARVPVGRNLLNSDSYYGRNLLNSEEPPPEEPHDIMMRLLGREPTPDEVGARMMDALQRGAAPDPAGDNLPDRGPFSFVNDAITGVRDRYDMYQRQFDGEGRREENVPELPWNVQIGGKDTWVGAKMGLGRGNDRAVDDIALAQLPGAGFRRDADGNLIVRLPGDATVSEAYAGGNGFDPSSVYETRQRPIGGQEFYVNRPGLSGQDVMNWGVGRIPGLANWGVGGAALAATKNPFYALAAGAAATAGGNIFLDKLAEKAGSRQGVDYLRAAEEGRDDLSPSFLDFADWVKKTRK